jgi:hypothetical protein
MNGETRTIIFALARSRTTVERQKPLTLLASNLKTSNWVVFFGI